MNLHQAQKEIAIDTHRFRVVNCGRRFGKTTLAVLEVIGKTALHEGKRVAYIAPTYAQARDITWHEFKKHIPEDCSAKPIYNEQRLEIALNNGSRIWLRGWESIESLRGQRLDYLVIDEVAMMKNFWLNWQEVVRPTLTDTRGGAMFISTPKGFNHFYDLYNLERQDEDYKSFTYKTRDNPYIPADEIEKARQELTEDRFAQEYEADFRKTEGLVYKEFDRKKHLFDDKTVLPQFVERNIGVDFGYNHPSAVVVVDKDGDGNYWIRDEWYKKKKTTKDIIEIVQSYEPNGVYPDPAEPDRLDEMEQAGLNVMDVVKGKGSVGAGIDRVRQLFKQGRIKIHKNCINLIWELETYRYKDKKNSMDHSEEPVKEGDDALDALRYVLVMNATQIVTAEDKMEDFDLYKQNYA